MIRFPLRIGVAIACWASAAVMATAGPPVHPACHCRSGGGLEAAAAEFPSYELGASLGAAPVMIGGWGDLPPPPGTLGQTYQRPSFPVPAAKHPRAGLIDVRAPGANDVVVQWLNAYRLQDQLSGFVDARDATLWHFEDVQLIPGVPHVVRVEARYGTPESYTTQVKYARLIMGRVVDVSF